MINQLRRLARPLAGKFPTIAMIYRRARDGWQIRGEPRETPMGFKLMGNPSMQNGTFEPEETRIFKMIIPQVDVFINVGANIGYYCCIALSLGKQVIAFEPLHLNLQYLLKNIKANHWEREIEVFPMALSNKVGVVEIYGGGTGASLVKGWAGTPESYVTLVPTSTLDGVLGARLQGKRCFVQVDIEGAEQSLLEGAPRIIDMEPRPVWMVEVSISEHQPKGALINPNLSATFHYFWTKDYEAFTADKQRRVIHPDEIKEITNSGVDTLQTHNFLFVEKGKRNEFFNA